VNEENDQVTSGIRSSQSGIHILAGTVSFFNEAKARTIPEDFNDFSLLNGVFPQKFLNNVSEPDEAGDIQDPLSFSIHSAIQESLRVGPRPAARCMSATTKRIIR